jgi:hypothetical protein
MIKTTHTIIGFFTLPVITVLTIASKTHVIVIIIQSILLKSL